MVRVSGPAGLGGGEGCDEAFVAAEEGDEEVEDLRTEAGCWFGGGEAEADGGGYCEEEQDEEGVEGGDEGERGREEGQAELIKVSGIHPWKQADHIPVRQTHSRSPCHPPRRPRCPNTPTVDCPADSPRRTSHSHPTASHTPSHTHTAQGTRPWRAAQRTRPATRRATWWPTQRPRRTRTHRTTASGGHCGRRTDGAAIAGEYSGVD